MTISDDTTERKHVIRIIALALTGFTCAYGVLVILIAQRPAVAVSEQPAAFRITLYTLSVIEFLVAGYWAVCRMGEELTLAEFQKNMVIAMGIAQSVVMCGLLLFFTTHRPAEFWPFMGATLALQCGLILPRVLQRTRDDAL